VSVTQINHLLLVAGEVATIIVALFALGAGLASFLTPTGSVWQRLFSPWMALFFLALVLLALFLFAAYAYVTVLFLQ
jgi:hypothetical protein